MAKRKRHLTKRDRKVLEFVIRYRVGTVDLLRRPCFGEDASLENVCRVLQRLTKHKLLLRVSSKSGFTYYTPTRHTFAVFGQEPRTPRPLTEQTLPVVMAVAFYCVAKDLRRLTSTEFQELYPELWRPGMRSSNYLLMEIDGKLRLELLLVDRGGAPHRMRSRVRRMIAQRKSLPAFQSLINSGRFRITVLTGTREQQQKIRNRIRQESFGPVTVSTFVVTELGDYLTLRK